MTERLGISSDVQFHLYPPAIASDLLAMQHLFNAYRSGPDLDYGNWWDFKRQVSVGHIVTGQIVVDRETKALFGIELMTRPNPWLNFLFYSGTIDRDVCREMSFWLYMTLQHWKMELGRDDERGAVRLQGRGGWQRIAKSMGFEMDRRGFVFDDQEGIKNGYVSRFQ